MVGKQLDIFRVFYNLVEVGRNKQTPAMGRGLAKGKITIENIICYQRQSCLGFFRHYSICPLQKISSTKKRTADTQSAVLFHFSSTR
jgi:hypothetical protein